MKKTIIYALALLITGSVTVRAADAKELWEKNCQKCHGEDGKGKTKMGEKLNIKDFSDPKNQVDLKDEGMIKAIKEGVKDGDKTRMKGFADVLSDDDIKALVAYVRTLAK